MVKIRSNNTSEVFDVGKLSREVLERTAPGLSDRTVLLLERERAKSRFLASLDEGVLFDYDSGSDTLIFSGEHRARFGLPEILVSMEDAEVPSEVKPAFNLVKGAIVAASWDNPFVNMELEVLDALGVKCLCAVACKAIWLEDAGEPRRMGAVGRIKIADGLP